MRPNSSERAENGNDVDFEPDAAPTPKRLPKENPARGTPDYNIYRAVRERRRARTVRFVVLESIVLCLMVASVCAGMSESFADENLTPIFRFLPVTCAIVAGLLPIIFFGSLGGRRR